MGVLPAKIRLRSYNPSFRFVLCTSTAAHFASLLPSMAGAEAHVSLKSPPLPRCTAHYQERLPAHSSLAEIARPQQWIIGDSPEVQRARNGAVVALPGSLEGGEAEAPGDGVYAMALGERSKRSRIATKEKR